MAPGSSPALSIAQHRGQQSPVWWTQLAPGAVGRGSAGTWGQGQWGTSCEPRAWCGEEGPSPPPSQGWLSWGQRGQISSVRWGSVDPGMPASAWTGGGCICVQSSDLGD